MSRLDCERWASQFDQQSTESESVEGQTALTAQHLKHCDECSREATAWRELGALVPSETERLERDLHLERAVLEQLDAPTKPLDLRSRRTAPRSKRNWWWGGLAAAALLASTLVWLRVPSNDVPANVTVGMGTAYDAQGRTHALGDRLRVGQTVSAGAAPLCLLIESGVRACLAAGGSLTLRDAALAHRRLELEHGRIVVELEKQPAGSSFSVSTPAGTATAIGTVFAVERAQNATATDVRVLEGAVVVQQAGAQHTLKAGQGKRLSAGEKTYELDSASRRRDLRLLKPDSTREDTDEVESVAEQAEPVVAAPSEAAKAPQVAERKSTPAELLQEALRLRAEGQFARAASIYRRLQSQFPGSGEARASLVSFGDLQLSRLGDAAGALRSFEAYLRGGGALSREASYGRVRALRALGRTADERAAIEQMLEQSPSGLYAASLRKRLKELE